MKLSQSYKSNGSQSYSKIYVHIGFAAGDALNEELQAVKLGLKRLHLEVDSKKQVDSDDWFVHFRKT
ncbi:unnamed protein product [Dovyalis caffra]|uniref:Uncharacterized protein n=1 Tax=Dovyalis caffra TaxID=77055 RepID=A0AAV1SJX8_9ROSI|nr:unnamed protein product [Dovyalis caffra]